MQPWVKIKLIGIHPDEFITFTNITNMLEEFLQPLTEENGPLHNVRAYFMANPPCFLREVGQQTRSIAIKILSSSPELAIKIETCLSLRIPEISPEVFGYQLRIISRR